MQCFSFLALRGIIMNSRINFRLRIRRNGFLASRFMGQPHILALRRKVCQPNFPLMYSRNRRLSRVLWLNDAAAEKMELMFLGFLIDDYDILREDRKQRSLARNLNAASARVRLLLLSLQAPSFYAPRSRDSSIFIRPRETSQSATKAEQKFRRSVTVGDFDVESESEKMTPRAQSSSVAIIELDMSGRFSCKFSDKAVFVVSSAREFIRHFLSSVARIL